MERNKELSGMQKVKADLYLRRFGYVMLEQIEGLRIVDINVKYPDKFMVRAYYDEGTMDITIKELVDSYFAYETYKKKSDYSLFKLADYIHYKWLVINGKVKRLFRRG